MHLFPVRSQHTQSTRGSAPLLNENQGVLHMKRGRIKSNPLHRYLLNLFPHFFVLLLHLAQSSFSSVINYKSSCHVHLKFAVSHFHSRRYRLTAYRQFAWWIYHYLGAGHREVLPSCAVWKIRDTFPSEAYVGFRYPEY